MSWMKSSSISVSAKRNGPARVRSSTARNAAAWWLSTTTTARGACACDKAEARRVRILKVSGFNAIRSAHNPISKALLDARTATVCMLWTVYGYVVHGKNKYDYASDFDAWYREDIKSMVDMISTILGHMYPSNEVSEPYQERGVQLTREMVDYLHDLDPNRAVTAGINLFLIYLASKGRGIYKEEEISSEGHPEKKKKPAVSGSLFFNMATSLIGPIMSKIPNLKAADQVTSPGLDALDIAGYNYAMGRYPLEGKKHPDRIVVGSETFHKDIAANWAMVEKYPYLIGDFMWTSWDYLGEASIGAWAYDRSPIMNKPYPWLSSECGAIDLLGHPGAPAKYAAVVWGFEEKPYIGVRPVNHPGIRPTKGLWRGTDALDSWSWKNCEGNKAEIEVYADAHSVELFLNGKSLGKKKLDAYKALYKTKYAPGSVKAVAYDQNDHQISASELVSATGKMRIALNPEDTVIRSGELVYVHVDLVGENGIVESNDDKELTVTVVGGALLGFGSANPCTEERFDSGCYTPYYGRSLAVVQGTDIGEMTIRVTGAGLEPAEAKIRVTE